MIRSFSFGHLLTHECLLSLPNLVHQPLKRLSSFQIVEVKILRQLRQVILWPRLELFQILLALLTPKVGLFALCSVCTPHARRPTDNSWRTAILASRFAGTL